VSRPDSDLNSAQYRALAEFRFRIRRFVRFSEDAARAAGLEPHQHQLLLAVKGYAGEGEGPTIGYLAEQLQIKHNSAVELLGRMSEGKLIRREPGTSDRRQVIVRLTSTGERLLQKLTEEHLAEIQETGPELVEALEQILPVKASKR
jgi:DNA-binding MarR family transcriptional regulator